MRVALFGQLAPIEDDPFDGLAGFRVLGERCIFRALSDFVILEVVGAAGRFVDVGFHYFVNVSIYRHEYLFPLCNCNC